LIKKHLADVFDFIKCVDDISNRISNIKKEYDIEFMPYLLQFKKENCDVDMDSIKEIAAYILLKEFELSIRQDGYLRLTKYTKSQIADAVLCVLKEKSKLLTIGEMYDLINHKYPEIIKERKRLGEICKNFPDMIYFGKTKTYGLKVWNDEKNSDGLTIKDLAAEYLIGKTEPACINDVIAYVEIYYHASTEDIRSNLKFNPQKRFVFLKNNAIDLKAKDYVTAKYLKTRSAGSKEHEWRINYNKALAFIQENNRLPLFSGPMEERTIYKFLQGQQVLFNKGKLSRENQELYEKIGFQTRKMVQTKIWMNGYDNLKKFREVHTDRWPIFKNGAIERALFNFCRKNKWRIRVGKLSKQKRDLLNEIHFHLFAPE
jgi:hypothetical protein